MQEILPQFREQAVAYAPKIFLALVTLFIGLRLIKVLDKFFDKVMSIKKYDTSLKTFLISLSDLVLKVALVISVISILGVETTSFIAVLGSAGLAVGLALQGSLANFAGGVMLLIFKPFREGDFIQTQGYEGTVRELNVFHTIMNTIDNKRIVLPNGSVANGALPNFTINGTRRADQLFGIGYGDDLKKAKEILTRLVNEDPRVLKDPAPLVIVHSLGDSSVNLQVRAWAKNDDFWAYNWDMTEKVKMTFDKEGISIPFPQRDLHIIDHKNKE
ncbi:MAG: mechanosensitive ion channel protein MscS [Halobacteriovorax sp.]|nr:mechanosensitive ion channel protein MscS [Halobacteriovorax sp.]